MSDDRTWTDGAPRRALANPTRVRASTAGRGEEPARATGRVVQLGEHARSSAEQGPPPT